ncbi:hypothetical protein [Thiohalobacter sp.]|uniref:hypothetical protein n=1 Tax=Thiohalobacter sp. TaxID=2025948 RepID=UPI002633726F|nr:hypothetical protein [Thiohalobacter sp.]
MSSDAQLNDVEALAQCLRPVFEDRPVIEAVFLFGSHTTIRVRPDFDHGGYDILVLQRCFDSAPYLGGQHEALKSGYSVFPKRGGSGPVYGDDHYASKMMVFCGSAVPMIAGCDNKPGKPFYPKRR